MDLSIIIVNWNTKALLLECLHSIYARSLSFELETIVVDNGSDDDSVHAVQRTFPNVRIIENGQNIGFAAANNIGMRASSGDFVCLMNSDVQVLGDCLERMLKYMRLCPEIGMCGPMLINSDGSFQLSCKHVPNLWNTVCMALGLHMLLPRSRFLSGTEMGSLRREVTQEVEVIVGAFWVARAAALSAVGLLDKDFFFYGEDIDWCTRCWKAGWKVVYFPGAQAIHHGGQSSSRDPNRFSKELFIAKLKYWRKHKSTPMQVAFIATMFIHHALRLGIQAARWPFMCQSRTAVTRRMKSNLDIIKLLMQPSRLLNKGLF